MKTGHRLVKQFNGHSGSNVFLREWPGGGFYVEKIGNTERNHERMTALLDAGYPVPKIYHVEKDYRDWETDRKSTRLNSSHSAKSRMPSSA